MRHKLGTNSYFQQKTPSKEFDFNTPTATHLQSKLIFLDGIIRSGSMGIISAFFFIDE
jgi:hypothetical protein